MPPQRPPMGEGAVVGAGRDIPGLAGEPVPGEGAGALRW